MGLSLSIDRSILWRVLLEHGWWCSRMSSNWSKELLLLKEDFEEEANYLCLSPIPHENPNNARNESRSTIKALPLSFLRFFFVEKVVVVVIFPLPTKSTSSSSSGPVVGRLHGKP